MGPITRLMKQDLNCRITQLYGDFGKILLVNKPFCSNYLQNHMGKQDLNCCITQLYGDFEKILPVKKLFWSNSLQNHMRRCEIMQFF